MQSKLNETADTMNECSQGFSSVYSLDWTTGLDYWTSLPDSPKMV